MSILKTGKVVKDDQFGTTILLPIARINFPHLVDPDDFFDPPKQCATLIFDSAGQYPADLNAVVVPALTKIAKDAKIKIDGQTDEGLNLGQGMNGPYMVFQPSEPGDEGYYPGQSETTCRLVLKTNPRHDKTSGEILPVTCFRFDKTRMTAEEIKKEIYDGCYVRVIMIAKAQRNKKTGKPIPMVCLYLNQVQKWAEGERLGDGGSSGDGFGDEMPESDNGDLSQFE